MKPKQRRPASLMNATGLTDLADACVWLQLNIAYPPKGTQKKLEIDEDSKL